MRFLRALPALTLLPFLASCGYIHFGRLPRHSSTGGSIAVEAYTDLAREHKVLKQELALVRKETDALRIALERAGSRTDSPALAARLNEATQELTALRLSYAKLQAERAASSIGGDPAISAKLSELEEKLATSLRDYTQLQNENSRLRAQVELSRTENVALTEQLKSAATQNEQAQATLAQLNTELLLQKQARTRAEQATEAARAQLTAVMAQSSSASATAAPTSPASPATSSGADDPSSSLLRFAKAPPADSSPTAELRTNVDRLRRANDAAPPTEVNQSSPETVARPPETATATENPPVPDVTPKPPEARGRIHVVQAGDTLEKLAQRYYGSADQWDRIYSANEAALSNGRPLYVGMELAVPEE